MVPELKREPKLFCGKCEKYVDKVITYIEVKHNSYVTTKVCLPCFKLLCEGKIE